MKSSKNTPKSQNEYKPSTPKTKIRRFTKKKTSSPAAEDVSMELDEHISTKEVVQTDSDKNNVAKSKVKAGLVNESTKNKRKKSVTKPPDRQNNTSSPLKRQKVTDETSNVLEELVATPVKKLSVEKPVKRQKSACSIRKRKSVTNDENAKLDSPKVKKQTSAISKDSEGFNRREKDKKRNIKNSYYKIINTLPQEVKSRIDWSKENLNDMWSLLAPPTESKSGLVLKWIRKVSENEINTIQKELVNIKISERSLKNKLYLSFENYGPKESSDYSGRSIESSSKRNSERYTPASKSKPAPSRIINFNGVLGEDNSACSKTSSNTKPSPNVVRIPLNYDKQKTCASRSEIVETPFYHSKEPKIVSIDPGKSIIVRFENPKSSKYEERLELNCKRNILTSHRHQDIVIENLDEHESKDIKYINIMNKHPNQMDHSINVFSSIGDEHDPSSVHYNWVINHESQDLNISGEKYTKPEAKYIILNQSNISQMMESVEECEDFRMSKQLHPASIDPMKNYHMGGSSILNQFCNNITPVFSINEDLGDNIRPNILESDFWINIDGDMMLTEEFKPPIETHNQ